MENNFKLGEIVYHRSVYEHKEQLKIIGITKNSLLLEGDYSGGTNNTIQSDWLPIKGTSRIYNHAFKLKARNEAIETKETTIVQDGTYLSNMINYVIQLTNDVSLNPEF